MERESVAYDVAEPCVRVPKVNWLLILSVVCILAGIVAGVYAQIVGHHQAFATTRSMPWGMLIGVYAYFAIISTGLCLMAALTHLFHHKPLFSVANRMIWLSIVFLLAAFTVIGLEIENPWRMPLNMITSPNVTSNIWWMGTLYGLALGVLGLELYLIITGRLKGALMLGLTGAVAETLANTNLGSVFGSLAARPLWYGSQLPVFFLASALLSGAAAVIVFVHFAYSLQEKRMDEQVLQGLQTSGKIMSIMLFLITLATAWKVINAYCGTGELRVAADALIIGPLALHFWFFELSIGLVLPFVLLSVTRMQSIKVMSFAALMVLVGQFFSRYNLVIGGVLVPIYPSGTDMPLYQSYSPSVSEYLLVLGGFGVVLLGFLAGEKELASVFSGKSAQGGGGNKITEKM